jgi:hypothetical protein
MAQLSEIVLFHPDGSPQPLSGYAGRPVVLQTLRYFG